MKPLAPTASAASQVLAQYCPAIEEVETPPRIDLAKVKEFASKTQSSFVDFVRTQLTNTSRYKSAMSGLLRTYVR